MASNYRKITMSNYDSVGVIGGGSWGTTLAHLSGINNNKTFDLANPIVTIPPRQPKEWIVSVPGNSILSMQIEEILSLVKK